MYTPYTHILQIYKIIPTVTIISFHAETYSMHLIIMISQKTMYNRPAPMAHSYRLGLVTWSYQVWIPVGPDICHRGCTYTVLQTVQRNGVYIAAYGTVHYKEPFKSFEIRVGHIPGFRLPPVAILPWLCRERRKSIFTHHTCTIRWSTLPKMLNRSQCCPSVLEVGTNVFLVLSSMIFMYHITMSNYDIDTFKNNTYFASWKSEK